MKRHRRSISLATGAIAAGMGLALLVDGASVHEEFYIAIAAAIPVFLLALLLRLAGLRDVTLEMLDDATDKQFSEELHQLQAAAIDEARRAELAKVKAVRASSAKQLEAMAPSIFTGLIGTYILAAIGEGVSLVALAQGRSTTLTFVASVLSIAGILGSLFYLELFDYRVRFVDRGMLFGLRGIRRVDHVAEFRRQKV